MSVALRIVFQSGLFFFLSALVLSPCHAQEQANIYSFIFGWKTEGSIDILARTATVFKKLKNERGVTLSFGSLLGPARIVQFDEGAQFLAAARDAGIDYVIPGAQEFMYGADVFKSFLVSGMAPRFISANLIDENTGEHLVTPYVVSDVSGLKVCIIGMSDMNTIKNASDDHVRGIDILSFEDAMKKISRRVVFESADLVIIAGRLDNKSIRTLAVRYPFIDAFLTNNQPGGFSDAKTTTTTLYVAGKPVFIGSESNGHQSILSVSYVNGIESLEFADITLGEEYPPDPVISSRLNKVLEKLLKTEYEDSVFVRTGTEVALVLKHIFKVDAVLLDRKCLYYYPLRDSLTVLNIRNIITPGNPLEVYSLRGDYLVSICEKSRGQTFPDMRLIFSGLTAEGKIDSIPVQHSREYTVLTTSFLRHGGDGYDQFKNGRNVIIQGVDILKTVESYLVAKEERIRRALKLKIWELNLFLTLNSNFNREDVDEDKQVYGDRIPKPFLEMTDKYTGNFILSSQNNILTMNKTIGRKIFENYLKFSYSRLGTKTEKKKGIQYSNVRNHDPVELYNKYTYNVPKFPIKPYIDMKVNTFLYSGEGKHPVTGTISMGGTRTFTMFMDMNLGGGIHGTRDYYLVENSFGTNGTITINKSFAKNLFFSKEAALSSKTNIYWNPAAKYNMEFKLDSDNALRIELWNKINGTFIFRAYSYRNSIRRKVATGFYYLFTLDYGMRWKI